MIQNSNAWKQHATTFSKLPVEIQLQILHNFLVYTPSTTCVYEVEEQDLNCRRLDTVRLVSKDWKKLVHHYTCIRVKDILGYMPVRRPLHVTVGNIITLSTSRSVVAELYGFQQPDKNMSFLKDTVKNLHSMFFHPALYENNVRLWLAHFLHDSLKLDYLLKPCNRLGSDKVKNLHLCCIFCEESYQRKGLEVPYTISFVCQHLQRSIWKLFSKQFEIRSNVLQNML